MVEFNRWFLAAFFLFVAAFYTCRILLLKVRLGHSPVYPGTPFDVHFLTHAAFRIFRAAILLACVIRLIRPTFDAYLGPFMALWQPAVLLAGDILLACGFGFVVWLHLGLGGDWRSGLRQDGGGRLHTQGPYGCSRNPMMLGVLTAQLGLFLALPSAFTLVCLVVGWLAVHAQVRVEEAALSRRHGADYDAYRARVPRWLPLARLR